jgi:hypothetical protein
MASWVTGTRCVLRSASYFTASSYIQLPPQRNMWPSHGFDASGVDRAPQDPPPPCFPPGLGFPQAPGSVYPPVHVASQFGPFNGGPGTQAPSLSQIASSLSMGTPQSDESDSELPPVAEVIATIPQSEPGQKRKRQATTQRTRAGEATTKTAKGKKKAPAKKRLPLPDPDLSEDPEEQDEPAAPRRGRQPGARQYSNEELDQLLDIIANHKPNGPDAWRRVESHYSIWAKANNYPVRKLSGLRQKYDEVRDYICMPMLKIMSLLFHFSFGGTRVPVETQTCRSTFDGQSRSRRILRPGQALRSSTTTSLVIQMVIPYPMKPSPLYPRSVTLRRSLIVPRHHHLVQLDPLVMETLPRT